MRQGWWALKWGCLPTLCLNANIINFNLTIFLAYNILCIIPSCFFSNVANLSILLSSINLTILQSEWCFIQSVSYRRLRFLFLNIKEAVDFYYWLIYCWVKEARGHNDSELGLRSNFLERFDSIWKCCFFSVSFRIFEHPYCPKKATMFLNKYSSRDPPNDSLSFFFFSLKKYYNFYMTHPA